LIAIEDAISSIQDGFEVDGYDIGSGEMNIFLFTSNPEAALAKIRPLLRASRPWSAAYRDVNEDEYVVLEGPDHFSVT
jgi:hypothetical protein